ncbi:MAG: hypothetical protein HLUCCO02_12915 [Idiomarinaceae bacterium HL-53]|nr:MAG: hypothetical protein HLUCCO02_12915 [Idiomarinaceae bacterium HL-53]CUS49343.1 hypothetical protein Ga0003345_2332 [Idiomarinaceae bacterium HL-53]
MKAKQIILKILQILGLAWVLLTGYYFVKLIIDMNQDISTSTRAALLMMLLYFVAPLFAAVMLMLTSSSFWLIGKDRRAQLGFSHPFWTYLWKINSVISVVLIALLSALVVISTIAFLS